MRTQHTTLLALASILALAVSAAGRFTHGDILVAASSGMPERLDMATKYPVPGPQCDTWVDVEMIFVAEVTEVCPDGSTVTETITECVSTLTHSICATPTTNLPCYPGVMAPPPSTGDTATVTVPSCSTAIDPIVTITIQLCGTCTSSTYVGTIPSYTPGGPCNQRTPYTSSTSSPGISASCSESGNATPVAVTTIETSTSTVIGCTPACTGSASSMSNPPGNPNVPSSTSSGSSSTSAATNTPYRPTTAAPSEVGAAGAHRITMGAIWAMGLMVVVTVFLGW
ncbi:hypothetical protein C8A03DRAFT_28870 [Achaetomium macrosporum]|uniref:Uncharacterized protein n=1 Tax=Achaetomium macrosporum TaxID=79813 RepID=A0AAN7CKT1_9PEZI|nr:hypothetical protein C8A03DRAFT_28870 [Achaetomium macrosporum]